MKRHIKLPLLAFFALFCCKYLYADSLRMDYCKDTEYYDMDAYNGYKIEYEIVSETINGIAKSDSAVNSMRTVVYCFGLPSADSSRYGYITSEGGYCRWKRVE